MPTSVHSSRYQLFAASAVAALWLTACGGGGGGGDVAAAPPPGNGQPAVPAPPPGVAPPSTPAPPPAAAIQLTASTTAQSNKQYQVNATGASTIDLTLPPSPAVGDTVSIAGVSANAWRLIPNAGQSVTTTSLNGNVAPGVNWTPELAPKVWHWISSDAAGDVLVASEANNGFLNTSRDGGLTWTAGDSVAGTWVSSDMSATGDKMVAVQFGGGMFISTNFGVNWTQVSDPLVSNAAGLRFESVTMSQDGTHLAAVLQPTTAAPNGHLVVSVNGGTTWTEPTLPPLTGGYFWRAVDSSADGQVIVAAEQNGRVFLSTDAGTTFNPVTVALAPSTSFTEGWYRVKMSADGNTIALAANDFGGHGPGSGIFVSHDRGATWTRGFTLNADYTALAMSSDGTKIAATLSNPNSNSPATGNGQVLLSTDSGATFAPLTMPGSDTDWRAIAMSSDGDKMATAAGNFLATSPADTGQLYTSLGNRTSFGSLGSITGGQKMSVQVKYLGNGQWSIPASTGGPFTIK